MSLPGSLSGQKVLETYDVLLKILEDGFPSSDDTQGRQPEHTLTKRDLTACAQSCRAFRDPALRILWSQIDSLLPLWHLLAPAGIAPPKTCTGDYIDLVVEAKLYEDLYHWGRFLKCAQLVRRLLHDSSICADGQAHLFKILLEHNRGESFLPSLRAIKWKRASSQDHSFALAFSPGVVDVTLSFTRQGSSAQLWRDTDLKPLLRRLHEASPPLEAFQLIIPTPVESWIVDDLLQFPRLRKLHGPFTLDVPSFITLVTSLDLVSLHVALSSDPAIDTPTSLPTLRMESLRDLKIQSHSQSISQIFTVLDAPRLRSLTVHIVDDPNSTIDYPAFMDSIANAVSADVMRSLVLEFNNQNYTPRAPRPPPIPLATLLHPILPMRNMQVFELKLAGRLRLSATNETFADITKRWSALRTFSLGIRDWHPDAPAPTPAVLMLFARACPNLRELVLPYLDHRALVLPFGGMPDPHPLLRLYIYDRLTGRESTNEESTQMTAYIHRLFPSIDLGFRHYGQNYELAWTKIFHRMKMMREAMSSDPTLV